MARQSKRNVAHHYDLSDRLYDLFLDADRQYSCAYYTDPANSLEEAQDDKKAHIAAKLALKPRSADAPEGGAEGGEAPKAKANPFGAAKANDASKARLRVSTLCAALNFH